jgi:arsenite/tail-anchored protein-transporting ATPase
MRAMEDISESGTAKAPRVLFFSGKGGVGKTTLAGTASLRLAREAQRVLVASTDPAHSLSDLFDEKIGGEAVNLAPGVFGQEIDAPSVVDKMLAGLGPIGEAESMSAAADLLKVASQAPGIDEIVSLDLLLRLIESPEYDSVVLDTAPTGHTLRLLALPELMDRYFGRLLTLRGRLSKISRRLRKIFRGRGELMNGEELGEELAEARGRMQMLAELMRDPERCSLVLVTIPEEMSVLETMRTVELLEGQGMPVTAVAVNMIQPQRPQCAFCSSRRRTHEAQLAHIGRLAGRIPLLLVEHEVDEPRGVEALERLSERVWAGRGAILGLRD